MTQGSHSRVRIPAAVIRLRRAIATGIGAVAILGSTTIAGAVPTVGSPTITPSSVNLGVSTVVTVSCPISTQPGDPALIPTSVNVLRLDAQNVATRPLGTMHDDGLNGDATAGDGMFTYQFTVTETTIGQIRLQCSAAFRGVVLRGRSPVGVIPIDDFRALPEAFPLTGTAPLTVTFKTRGVYTGGQILRFRWDFDGDGIFDSNQPGAQDFTRTFTTVGVRQALLEVMNDRNQVATATVAIDVAGAPPTVTAAVNPSNGPMPLTVNFTGLATRGTAPLAKYEWDFQGDGVFDFTSPTTAATNFVYTTAGTYNALLRVTDTAGLTGTARVTATAVRVGPPGSPTATITAPSTAITRAAAAFVAFNGTGSDPGGSIVRYEWDFEGDGVYDVSSPTTAATNFTYNSPGIFTAALRVTDNDGNTGVDTVDITVTITSMLTMSTDTLRAPASVNVMTSLSGTAVTTVYLRNRLGQTVRTLANNVARTAGSYTDTWDGNDDTGLPVPEGEYFAILQYLRSGTTPVVLDRTTTSGNQFYNPDWELATTKGGSCSDCDFAPYDDNFLQATFTLTQASEVTVSIRGYDTVAEVAALFERKPFGRGVPYTVVWEGTNALGQLVHPSGTGDSQFIFGMTAFTLPANAVFVERAPVISGVTMTPNYFDPGTGDFLTPESPAAAVSFTLSKPASVRLQVHRTGTNLLMRTIQTTTLPAGTGTVAWDGRTDSGMFVAKGDYRVGVTAIDSSGNQSIVRYALVRVFY